MIEGAVCQGGNFWNLLSLTLINIQAPAPSRLPPSALHAAVIKLPTDGWAQPGARWHRRPLRSPQGRLRRPILTEEAGGKRAIRIRDDLQKSVNRGPTRVRR